MQFLISIYDRVGQVYFPIQVFENYGDMLRTIRAMASDKQSVFSQYPADYNVNFVGVFDTDGFLYVDDSSGLFSNYYFPALSFSDVLVILNSLAKTQNIDFAKVDGPSFLKAIHNFRNPPSCDDKYDFDGPSVRPIGKDW